MGSRDTLKATPSTIEEDDNLPDTRIEWSNLIFVPFNPIFQAVVLVCVVLKCIMGPIQSVFPIVHCWTDMDEDQNLLYIKYFYMYFCDMLYGIDTFLHIVHRQVTDKAMKREFLPKSAGLLLLDFLALIPFFRMAVSSDCPPQTFWPNVLAFSEFLIIYRVPQYYELASSHSYVNLTIGFLLLLACVINCLTCFWLLLTFHGLCMTCTTAIRDWRVNVLKKVLLTGVYLCVSVTGSIKVKNVFLNHVMTFNLSLTLTDHSAPFIESIMLHKVGYYYSLYVYAMVWVWSYFSTQFLDEVGGNVTVEFIAMSVVLYFGYIVVIAFVMPKLFSESSLRLKRVCTAYPHIKKLLDDTERRNPSRTAIKTVEHFFNTMWMKRDGMSTLPPILAEVPRYLKIELQSDLIWPLIHHSPVLRKTSLPFMQWVSEYVVHNCKLAGETFYSGPQSYSHLYYVKSGVVQLLSTDDGLTPVLSFANGTLIGDSNFLTPPTKISFELKCLTFCEIMYLSRKDYISALHKFPRDRRLVLQLANERLRHAKSLFDRKKLVKGKLDRAEDEEISWFRKRWWEMFNTMENWKKKHKKEQIKCEFPPEKAAYHCSKYIGQVILATEAELSTKSLFAKVTFPWILLPYSQLITIWYKIVLVTVFLVLIFYPPNITKSVVPTWFMFFQIWTNLIYSADICISILTTKSRGLTFQENFSSIMFAQCKTLKFNLDLIATIWIEYFILIIGLPEYFFLIQFNRLIKVYMLFEGVYLHWDVKEVPLLRIFYKICLLQFCKFYISAYIVYALARTIAGVDTTYFFGQKYCLRNENGTVDYNCDPGGIHEIGIALSWTASRLFYSDMLPQTLKDIYIALSFSIFSYVISIYCKATLISALFLHLCDLTSFQSFVTNLRKYYMDYKIHNDLLKRLEVYLTCHWRYFNGAEVMHPNAVKSEVYEVYWRVQGEIAEKIIAESEPFYLAERSLIRDLANASKFLILPKTSTLFLFGVECYNVTWIVQGVVKCEYFNDQGERIYRYFEPGLLLSPSSVYLRKESLRTFTAYTDIEIMYVKYSDFYKIYRRHPTEWSHLQKCIAEFNPIFEDMYQQYLIKHNSYQKKLRNRIFHARRSTVAVRKSFASNIESGPTMVFDHDIWTDPESGFVKYWLFFRVIIVILSIIFASIRGGTGASYSWFLRIASAFCDCMMWVDIIVKLFFAHYDHRGILIYGKRACIMHYLSTTFWVDILGAFPWYEILRSLMSEKVSMQFGLVFESVCKFSHVYIVIGFFNYVCDTPSIYTVYLKILKWQIVSLLLMFTTSNFLMVYCLHFTFDIYGNTYNRTLRDQCWFPLYFAKVGLNSERIHLIYAESINLAQCGLLGINHGRFQIHNEQVSIPIILSLLLMFYWFVLIYSLTLLVLSSRGNTLFKHGVYQLKEFLENERIKKKVITRAVSHFTYWWKRTNGINITHLTNERLGVVFRQDLSYFFFKETFAALNTLLLGGDTLARKLSSASMQMFVLPGEKIIREMDLSNFVYVVHRGRVIIKQHGEKVNSLGKGSIFGQLTGTKARPSKISAKADGHADLLQITIKKFQEYIDDSVRETIEQNFQANSDYMATEKRYTEDPYNSIQYILRGVKRLKLPWMKTPIEAQHNSWYFRWLYIAWLFEPALNVFFMFTMLTVRSLHQYYIVLMFIGLDLIFLMNMILEYYNVELIVYNKICVDDVVKQKIFRRFDFYIETFCLFVPYLTYVTDYNCYYQVVRLVRLRRLFSFHQHFCMSFKSIYAPFLLKILSLCLLWHSLACGHILIGCRKVFHFDFSTEPNPEIVNKRVDWTVWHKLQEGSSWHEWGCPIPTSTTSGYYDKYGKSIFIVPVNWWSDYILAMANIVAIHLRTPTQTLVPLSTPEIYYHVFMTFVIVMIDLWIASVAISFVYTKYREMYQFEYNVNNLIDYLSHSGLSPGLFKIIRKYTSELWTRQRGNWLPELAIQAPTVLREDIFCELYMHHLDNLPVLRDMPTYFRRQVAARMRRFVVYPGKILIKEGDIYPCMFFIHEGEVEKGYFDKTGEYRMMSMLGTSGYFGLIPGLFPNFPYQFSYITRTVVDLVVLRLSAWEDLMDGYPNIKRDIYKIAMKIRHTVHAHQEHYF